MDITETLTHFANEFSSWPREVRAAVFALGGAMLTYFAIPLFEHEFLMALIYMALAVGCFWLAIAPFL